MPFDHFHPGQEKAILDISMSSKKIIVLEGPTGSGKSGIALAVSRIMDSSKSVIVCHTKQLQEQYRASFSELPTVVGRNNFPCEIDARVTAESARCTVAPAGKCRAFMKCSYYEQIRTALVSPISVHNYSYWLLAANREPPSFSDLDLLVCDEAHLLPNMLQTYISVRIDSSKLHKALGEAMPKIPTDEIETWRAWAEVIVDRLREEVQAYEKMSFDDSRLTASGIGKIRAVQALYRDCMILATVRADWVITEMDNTRGIGYEFKPTWVDSYAQDLVFKHAGRVLLMSATIGDIGVFCEELGLSPDDIDFIRMDSTFPPENRPVIIRPIARVKSGMTGADEAAIVAEIDRILDSHPNEKGLIHTTNYGMVNLVMARSKHRRRLITHNSRDRSSILAAFKKAAGPLVLLSPSMSTGVDLPEEQCRFVVWMKLPFPSLGDAHVKARLDSGPRGQRWYTGHTANELWQGLGRGVRGPTDKCTSYIIDANIVWFLDRIGGTDPEVESAMPKWLKEAVVW